MGYLDKKEGVWYDEAPIQSRQMKYTGTCRPIFASGERADRPLRGLGADVTLEKLNGECRRGKAVGAGEGPPLESLRQKDREDGP